MLLRSKIFKRKFDIQGFARFLNNLEVALDQELAGKAPPPAIDILSFVDPNLSHNVQSIVVSMVRIKRKIVRRFTKKDILETCDGATAKFQKALELHPRLTLDVQAEIIRYPHTGSDVNDVNLTITADNIATRRKTSKKTWDWTVFIQGPEHLLDQVDYVEYTLHPSFRSPPQIVRNRGTGPYAFSLSASGWGAFTIKIRVFLKDGHVQHLSHFLRFVDSRQ